MSPHIVINANQIEAKPFYPEKFFINPDKQLVNYELPSTRNFEEIMDSNNPFKENIFSLTKIDAKI